MYVYILNEIILSITVEKVLKDGRVPPVPHNSVRRVELVKSIRRELRKMKDTDSWVVVHGLPGFGETPFPILLHKFLSCFVYCYFFFLKLTVFLLSC